MEAVSDEVAPGLGVGGALESAEGFGAEDPLEGVVRATAASIPLVLGQSMSSLRMEESEVSGVREECREPLSWGNLPAAGDDREICYCDTPIRPGFAILTILRLASLL